MKLRILIAIAFIIAAIGYCANAHAAGTATNDVTLSWNIPTNTIPFVYEVYSSTVVSQPSVSTWTVVATNIPSTTTNLTLQIDKTQRYFAVLAACSTNTAWKSDFSNVASTLWPSPSGNLSIRLGP